jgi:hypothetical protein
MRMGASREAPPGLSRPGAVRRTDIVAAGIEPVASRAHSESDDIAGWPAFGAIAVPRPGTRDCNSALGDGWDERASRIP